MKIKKLFALTLCVAMTLGLLMVNAGALDTTVVNGTKAGLSTLTKTSTELMDNSGNPAGVYQIDLTAGTESDIQVTGMPCNIVLVLDASKTMKGNESTLKTAVDSFIDKVAETAPGSKIAVVGYAGSAIPYKGKNATTAANALQPVMVNKVDQDGNLVKDANGNPVKVLNAELKQATGAVSSATSNEKGVQKRADAGLEMAVDILRTVPTTDTAKPIVVLFTNGIPSNNVDATSFWDDSGDSYGIAQDSIHWSAILKADKGTPAGLDFNNAFYENSSRTDAATQKVMGEKNSGCGATVYCVGVNLPKTRGEGWLGSDSLGGDGNKVNEFMYRVSSHVKTGSHSETKFGSYTYYDSQTRNKGYYMVADDMNGLNGMFEDIEVDNGTTIKNVTYRDYIAPGFQPCDASGNPLVAGTYDGYTISVVDGVYCVEFTDITLNPSTDHSKDVTKTLYVKPAENFLGGNGVSTNVAGVSGVYSGDTNIGSFPATNTLVNVPVKSITPAVQGQTIYLGNQVNLGSLLAAVDPRIDGTNNANAVVTYEMFDSAGNSVCTYTFGKGAKATEGVLNVASLDVALTDCASYTLTCTVNGGTGNTATTADEDIPTATVHVVKPVISNSDTTIYLSNSINLNTQMTEAANWTCADGNSLPVMGTNEFGNTVRLAPGVDHTFTVTVNNSTSTISNEGAYAPTGCTPVTVVSKVGTVEVAPKDNDNSFKVHVLEPTVEAEDRTIWLSESVQSAAKVTGWNCACEGVTHTMHANSVKPNETITMPTVKPDDCTEYTATYTVGGKDFTDHYMVHVLTADLKMKNPVIYLSQTAAFADYDTVTWETKCDHGETPSYNPPAASAVVNDAATITPTTCIPCVADLKIGDSIYKKDVSFTVHVVCPVVTATNATIKLGNKAPETGAVSWKMQSDILGDKYICYCDGKHDANAMPSIVPTLSVQHTGDEYPTACSNNGHKATAVINGTLWEDYYANYTVHVQTPVVTGTDTTIYLGNETTLAAEITGWDKCSHNEELTNANEADPAAAYTFTDAASAVVTAAVKPKTCANYTAKLTQIGGVTLNGSEPTDAFTIHVLVPKFTVTTNDLWADCGTESVPLYDGSNTDAIANIKIDDTWVDRDGDSEYPDPAKDAKKDVTITDITFSEKDSYGPMGDTDVDVNVTKLTSTVNGENYEVTPGIDVKTNANLTVIKAKAEENHDFTIHVNTFALTVSHDGTQNAIFTLSDGTKVAVPAGSNTTIKGLICGKVYKIAENDNSWTWRYTDSATATNQNAITCTVGSVKTQATESSTTVTMTYDDVTNNKWLSGEAYAINNEKGRVDAATPAILNFFKKEGEE